MMPPDLQQPVLMSVVGVGFATAFLHAALPTHWLPFVLVGRGQRWTLTQVLTTVAIAGSAHIVTTAVVGGLIVAAGLVVDQWIAGLLPGLSAGLLFLFGALYLGKALPRPAILAGRPSLPLAAPPASHTPPLSGGAVPLGGGRGGVLLPIYLSQATEGPVVLTALTLAFGVGTVLGMGLFTVLARAGWSVLRLERWARYEGIILGLALILIGLLVILRPH